jgi:chemotaxis response regulator CheB
MDISKYLNVRGPQPWAEPVSSRNLVVLAASSGGLHALTEVLAALPADFPAAIAVV